MCLRFIALVQAMRSGASDFVIDTAPAAVSRKIVTQSVAVRKLGITPIVDHGGALIDNVVPRIRIISGDTGCHHNDEGRD